jgi:hypothetical protein
MPIFLSRESRTYLRYLSGFAARRARAFILSRAPFFLRHRRMYARNQIRLLGVTVGRPVFDFDSDRQFR